MSRNQEPKAFAGMPRRAFLRKSLLAGAGVVGLNLLGNLPAAAATRRQTQKLRMLSASGGISAPVMAPSADGRLELFTVGRDYNLYHRWQFDDLSWSDWYSHGTTYPPLFPWTGAPQMTLVQMADGTLNLITWDGGSLDLCRIQQVAPSSGWSDWQQLARYPGVLYTDDYPLVSPPVAALDGTGNLRLFVSSLYNETTYPSTIFQGTLTSGGSWSGWSELQPPPGYTVTSPITAANPDGRLELFGIGSGGNFWHTWQTSVGGSWNPWYSQNWPGVPLVDGAYPTIVPNADGRLEVFIAGNDGALYHLPQWIVNANWGNWESFGPPPGTQVTQDGAIAVGWSADGRRELFVVGKDNNLWHLWQTDLNGNWSNWYSHGAPPGTFLWGGVAVHLNRNNYQELFANAADGNMYSIKQVEPNGGWSGWINFGQP